MKTKVENYITTNELSVEQSEELIKELGELPLETRIELLDLILDHIDLVTKDKLHPNFIPIIKYYRTELENN